VAYGLITYQTAWLKTHYPVQYAAALISSQIGNNDKIIEYVRGVRNMGVQVLPPDINLSGAEFTTTEGAVVFGLSGMKGAGTKAIEAIVEARQSVGGRFKGFMHFLENIDHGAVGKSVLEALIRGGAFDSFQLTRAALMKNFEKAQRIAAEAAEDKKRGQKNIFGAAAKELTQDEERQRDLKVIGSAEEWSETERQTNEKEAFGFFISSSPLDTWREKIEAYRTHTSASIQDEKANRQVIFGGMLRSIREIKIKKEGSPNFGRSMAKIEMQDLDGVVNVTALPNDYERCQELLKEDSVVFLRGFTKDGLDEGMDIILAEVIPAEEAEARFKDDPLLRFGNLFKRYSSTSPDDLIKVDSESSVCLAG
ncbi:MAG: hypothetical protein KDB07_12150, partial [Planctomycetes bacterium]|nr:hypothetical protein [Planctomycetota bacterium]